MRFSCIIFFLLLFSWFWEKKICKSLCLKQKYASVKIPKFYSFLLRKSFPKLLSAARITAMFGSINVCEQFFPSTRALKSLSRSRVTDKHLQATLTLISTNEFKLNIEKLADA